MPPRKPDTTALRKEVERKRTVAGQLERAETRNRILSLVRNGANYQQVVDTLANPANGEPVKLTVAQVSSFVKGYLDRIHTEDALTIEQLRVLENQRIDALWAQLSASARNADGTPNLRVIDRLTRLSERRSRMNGFEAAQKHEHYIGNPLAALGLEQEHVQRAERAWLEVGGNDADAIEGEAVEIER
jgi:hypothetical protein